MKTKVLNNKVILKNKKGSLAVDFVFSMTIVLSISAIVFAISFSLSIAEIVQYIAYSTSRTYYASDFNIKAQEAKAENKYNSLVNNPVIKGFFGPQAWFEIKYLGSANYTDEAQENATPGVTPLFVGTKIEFKANILDFNMPIFGSTNIEEQEFKTNITSFLGREPSAEECELFAKDRWKNIIQLHASYADLPVPENAVVVFNDNGC